MHKSRSFDNEKFQHALSKASTINWNEIEKIDPSTLGKDENIGLMKKLAKQFIHIKTIPLKNSKLIIKLLQILQVIIEYFMLSERNNQDNQTSGKSSNKVIIGVQCPICSKLFKSIDFVDKHMLKIHPQHFPLWKTLRAPITTVDDTYLDYSYYRNRNNNKNIYSAISARGRNSHNETNDISGLRNRKTMDMSMYIGSKNHQELNKSQDKINPFLKQRRNSDRIAPLKHPFIPLLNLNEMDDSMDYSSSNDIPHETLNDGPVVKSRTFAKSSRNNRLSVPINSAISVSSEKVSPKPSSIRHKRGTSMTAISINEPKVDYSGAPRDFTPKRPSESPSVRRIIPVPQSPKDKKTNDPFGKNSSSNNSPDVGIISRSDFSSDSIPQVKSAPSSQENLPTIPLAHAATPPVNILPKSSLPQNKSQSPFSLIDIDSNDSGCDDEIVVMSPLKDQQKLSSEKTTTIMPKLALPEKAIIGSSPQTKKIKTKKKRKIKDSENGNKVPSPSIEKANEHPFTEKNHDSKTIEVTTIKAPAIPIQNFDSVSSIESEYSDNGVDFNPKSKEKSNNESESKSGKKKRKRKIPSSK